VGYGSVDWASLVRLSIPHFSGALTAQMFTPHKSVKRTAEMIWFWNLRLIFSRPLHGLNSWSDPDPSTEVLGYFNRPLRGLVITLHQRGARDVATPIKRACHSS